MSVRSSIVAAAIVATALVVLLGAGAAPAAAPTLTAACSPAPADCTGWYRSNVTVTWTAANVSSINCPPSTISSDTKGTVVSCTATGSDGQTKITVTVTVHVDKTPPSVSPGTDRGPDANGWFNHPVSIVFSGSDGTSGVAGCSSASYAGPDTSGVAIDGSCRDAAGNTSSAQVTIRYDATPPAVTKAKSARRPDRGRWYKRPIEFTFGGTDNLSGLESCAAVKYAGPDGPAVAVVGSCRDQAGNMGTRSFGLSYDATPPGLHLLQPVALDGVAHVHWRAAPDAKRFVLLRRRMRPGSGWTVVYRGRGKWLHDKGVVTRAGYVYRVRAWDAVGNVAVQTVGVRVRSSLRPPRGTHVRKRIVLRWAPSEGASYYNVQLYRKGVKVVTRWPTKPSLPVGSLKAGIYRWYVWPGLGKRREARYGRVLGSSTFVVR